MAPAAAGATDADVDGLEPERLPEVRELVAQGWQLAPDAPMFAFLPAVWPSELRTWVPDELGYRRVTCAVCGRMGSARRP